MTVAVPTVADDKRSAPAALFDIVAFGGSAGGITALIEILSLLPAAFPMPILVVQHLPRQTASLLPTSWAIEQSSR